MESLRETKIRIYNEDHSKAFQSHALSLGAKWTSGSKDVQLTKSKFLYIDSFGCISKSDNEAYFNDHYSKEIFYPERRQWSGEGIPPVGTKCEYLKNPDEWIVCEVFGHRKCSNDDTEVFISIGGSWDYTSDPALFRPLKTPEQIAAEKRQHAIDEMMDLLESYSTYRDAIGILYDAGYRKTEVKK